MAIDALVDRFLDDQAVAATVIDEGDKGGGTDGLESDTAGYLYTTNYEHQAILRRSPQGEWQTVVHDPRLMWTDTMSVATDGYLYINPLDQARDHVLELVKCLEKDSFLSQADGKHMGNLVFPYSYSVVLTNITR